MLPLGRSVARLQCWSAMRSVSTSQAARNLEQAGDTAVPKLIGFKETVADVAVTARMKTRPLSVKQLYEFSANATPQSLLQSAQFLHLELPVRVAGRLIDFQKMPFLTGCNPDLRAVYELYSEAYVTLRKQRRVTSEDDLALFHQNLMTYLDDHQNVITMLARGVKASKTVLADTLSEPLNGFLDRSISSRIGLRLLIENQVALAHQVEKGKNEGVAGILHLQLSPAKTIAKMEEITRRMCHNRYGVAPKIKLHGDTNTVFSYIPAHLEYILQELFKNAFRASVEQHRDSGVIPDVDITVCRNKDFMILRISDQGGGMSAEMLKKCWAWSFTTVDDDDDDGGGANNMFGGLTQSEPDGPLAGLGFGLPMTKLFSQYFGGSLEMIPMHGYGTDVYLTLKDLNSKSAGSI
eukprot:m.223173 g.223173  ORF g.223173 m.223173 type:complete len:408 (+) comp25836_c0_seq1:73-1296(+)